MDEMKEKEMFREIAEGLQCTVDEVRHAYETALKRPAEKLAPPMPQPGGKATSLQKLYGYEESESGVGFRMDFSNGTGLVFYRSRMLRTVKTDKKVKTSEIYKIFARKLQQHGRRPESPWPDAHLGHPPLRHLEVHGPTTRDNQRYKRENRPGSR